MPAKYSLLTAPIALTDFETTGLDWCRHEIIEIGLLVVQQPGLEIVSHLDLKVKPERLEEAEPEALAVNGYTPDAWANAVPLTEAMAQYVALAEGAIFMSFNLKFDSPFLDMALRQSGVRNIMGRHRLCLLTSVYDYLRESDQKSFRLADVCRTLGLPPEPPVHRAIHGALAGYRVLRRLRQRPDEPDDGWAGLDPGYGER